MTLFIKSTRRRQLALNLNEAEEARVAKLIGFWRTRQELCTVIKKILDAADRPNPFGDSRPGRKWLKRFFERHTELTSRTIVQLGKERAIICKGKITKWFDDFTSYINDELKEQAILSDPTCIYNANESVFSLCPSKAGKVRHRSLQSCITSGTQIRPR